MRKDLGRKTLLYPMPALIVAAYDKEGKTDALTAAWAGIDDDYRIGICLTASHHTSVSLMERGAATVSIADAAHVKEADYLGIISANKTPDKFARSGLHSHPSAHVDAPVIDEFPLTFECRVVSHDTIAEDTIRVVAEIVNVSADERILTDGKIDIAKLDPLVFDGETRRYMHVGGEIAKAFSAGKSLADGPGKK